MNRLSFQPMDAGEILPAEANTVARTAIEKHHWIRGQVKDSDIRSAVSRHVLAMAGPEYLGSNIGVVVDTVYRLMEEDAGIDGSAMVIPISSARKSA